MYPTCRVTTTLFQSIFHEIPSPSSFKTSNISPWRSHPFDQEFNAFRHVPRRKPSSWNVTWNSRIWNSFGCVFFFFRISKVLPPCLAGMCVFLHCRCILFSQVVIKRFMDSPGFLFGGTSTPKKHCGYTTNQARGANWG